MVFISAWEQSRSWIKPKPAGKSLQLASHKAVKHSDFFFLLNLGYRKKTGATRGH